MNITFKFCVLLLIPYLNVTVQFKYDWVAAELWNNQMYICHLSTTVLKNSDLEIFGNGYWLGSNLFQPAIIRSIEPSNHRISNIELRNRIFIEWFGNPTPDPCRSSLGSLSRHLVRRVGYGCNRFTPPLGLKVWRRPSNVTYQCSKPTHIFQFQIRESTRWSIVFWPRPQFIWCIWNI